MRIIHVLLAALLCCTQAFAQEAVSIIPRFDYNPVLPLKDGGQKCFNDFGNTTLYAEFEGAIGNSPFSYFVQTHLLSWRPSPADLYNNTFRSDDQNWLNYANITYTRDNFSVTAGKDFFQLGTFELDNDDYDVHYNNVSNFWTSLSSYQWAVTMSWLFDDERSNIKVQGSTSPFGENFFASKLYGASLYWRGDYGHYQGIWSVNYAGTGVGTGVGFLASGNKLTFGDLSIGLDYVARANTGNGLFSQENSFIGSIGYDFTENFNLMIKAGYEFNDSGEDVMGYVDEDDEQMGTVFIPTSLAAMKELTGKNYKFGSLVATWYPVENLRVHCSAAANNWANSLSLTMGITYTFDVCSLFRK